MKKVLLAILALAAAFSCTKTPEPSISLSTETVNVNFDGAERVAVDITANRDWTITTDGATWYTVEPLSGNGDATIYITVDPLETVATRAAELVLTAESATTRLLLPTNCSRSCSKAFTFGPRGTTQLVSNASCIYFISLPLM